MLGAGYSGDRPNSPELIMRWLIAIALITGASVALAQSIGGQSGIANIHSSGSGGSSSTPCNAGQLDFSVITGCNTVFMTQGLP